MTPFYQTVPHNPPHSFGDCHRTAIACILDIPPDRIPHIAGVMNGKAWLRNMNDALHPLGYQIASISFSGCIQRAELMAMMQSLNPTVYYILIGVNKREVRHAVVCRGGSVAHDTNASSEGVVSPVYDDDLKDYFWIIHFLVKA